MSSLWIEYALTLMKKEETNCIVEENEFRKGMYLLLSRIYGWEPDRKLLEDISEALTSATVEKNQVITGWEDLRVYFKPLSFDQNGLDQLCAEFAELFLGIGKKSVYPYESVYTEKHFLVMGASTIEVRKFYKRNGYVKTIAFKEPDDHLSVEFEFMALLCHKMNQSLMINNFQDAVIIWSEQKDFFNQHIAKWVIDFCIEIIKNGRKNSFYAAFASIAKEFITFEKIKIQGQL